MIFIFNFCPSLYYIKFFSRWLLYSPSVPSSSLFFHCSLSANQGKRMSFWIVKLLFFLFLIICCWFIVLELIVLISDCFLLEIVQLSSCRWIELFSRPLLSSSIMPFFSLCFVFFSSWSSSQCPDLTALPSLFRVSDCIWSLFAKSFKVLLPLDSTPLLISDLSASHFPSLLTFFFPSRSLLPYATQIPFASASTTWFIYHHIHIHSLSPPLSFYSLTNIIINIIEYFKWPSSSSLRSYFFPL